MKGIAKSSGSHVPDFGHERAVGLREDELECHTLHSLRLTITRGPLARKGKHHRLRAKRQLKRNSDRYTKHSEQLTMLLG